MEDIDRDAGVVYYCCEGVGGWVAFCGCVGELGRVMALYSRAGVYGLVCIEGA